jgi:hypothetical protein
MKNETLNADELNLSGVKFEDAVRALLKTPAPKKDKKP